MAKDGGLFGTEEIDWFNGGLFDSAEVHPARRLRDHDPARGQPPRLGAHRARHLRHPLRARPRPRPARPARRPLHRPRGHLGASSSRSSCARCGASTRRCRPASPSSSLAGRKVTKATPRADEPGRPSSRTSSSACAACACSTPPAASGNFLIVSLWALKDLEFEAIHWGSLVLQRPMQVPQVGPEAVLGIEINAYAAELARVTIWIGEIQWMIRHGLGYRRDPILQAARPHRDAATRCWTSPTRRTPARRSGRRPSSSSAIRRSWAAKLLRRGLGDDVRRRAVRGLRRPRPAHELTSVATGTRRPAAIETGRTQPRRPARDQAIRGGANRRVLERIKETGRHLLRSVR